MTILNRIRGWFKGKEEAQAPEVFAPVTPEALQSARREYVESLRSRDLNPERIAQARERLKAVKRQG